jgi:hypothetical protein
MGQTRRCESLLNRFLRERVSPAARPEGSSSSTEGRFVDLLTREQRARTNHNFAPESGGLITSMLFVLPTPYNWFERDNPATSARHGLAADGGGTEGT